MKKMKFALSILGTCSVIAGIAFSTTSCSAIPMTKETISKIMQILHNEFTAPSAGGTLPSIHIDDIPIIQPRQQDLQYWDTPADTTNHDALIAIANASNDVSSLCDVLKQYILDKITHGLNTSDGSPEPALTNLNYQNFNSQYFTVHLANIYANDLSNNPKWIYKTNEQYHPTDFKCDTSSSGQSTMPYNQNYVTDSTQATITTFQGAEYSQLLPQALYCGGMFDPNNATSLILPITGGIPYFMLRYLVTFSPQPYSESAPPTAFYIDAHLDGAKF